MTTQHKQRGLLARVGAIGAALAIVFAGASSAIADPLPETSNIEITKLSTPPAGPGDNATGQAQSIPTGATPIAGVQFEAYAVPVAGAVGSNEWQQNLAAIDVAEAQGLVGASPTDVGGFAATDPAGVTTWTAAPRGLYLLRETAAPAGVTPAADFLVAVPMTDPATGQEPTQGWLDTIYVYPKNSQVAVTKSIDDGAAVAVGENVSWAVTAQIPRDDVISEFRITDALDPRLTYVSSAVSLTSGPALIPADYTLGLDDVTGAVELAFTETGRAKLVQAWQETNGGAEVLMDVVTTINATTLAQLDAGNDTIVNTAELFVNGTDPVSSPGDVDGPAAVKLGEFTIIKTNAADTPAPVTGAVFSVYRTSADATARTNPIAINGATEFEVTEANGELTISGLLQSDFINGASVTANDFRTYWVNEVQAPDGFQLIAAPIEVEVLGIDGEATSYTVQNVENTPGGAFILPLTGGTGTWFLSAAGAALLALVLVALIRRRAASAAE